MRLNLLIDADDTLWHSESLYAAAQEEYRRLLAPYAEDERIDQVLHQTEMRNLPLYGYGIKGFALSMIEAALELSRQQITGSEVQGVLDVAKQMLSTDVELLESVAEVVAQLAERYPLMLITKGDLVHQEAKIEQSGLKSHFRSIEIVTDKTPHSYATLLERHQIDPARFLMIGNSLRYVPEGSRVWVTANGTASGVQVTAVAQGGVAPMPCAIEHLPRHIGDGQPHHQQEQRHLGPRYDAHASQREAQK